MANDDAVDGSGRPARFLLLYGSARPGSFSHRLVEEAGRLLSDAGGDVRLFDPSELPVPQTVPPTHPKVQALHEALLWSDAQLWCTPENYGTMSAVMKIQIDWAPPVIGGVPVFKGKPLAIAQVNGADPNMGASLSLTTVGRWLGMMVIPAQLCVAKAQEQFDAEGRLTSEPYRQQLAQMVADLVATTMALRAAA